MPISDILKTKGTDVVTIPPTTGIEQAAKILRERKFGALIIADKAGKMVGIMSERDIVRIVGEMGGKGLSLKVEDIMTRTVRTCKSTDSIDDLMQVMTKFHIRHVPIVDNDKLIGLVSQTDLIQQQLAEQKAQVQLMKNLNIAKTR